MAVANIVALIFLVSGSYHGAEAACNLTTGYHFSSQGYCSSYSQALFEIPSSTLGRGPYVREEIAYFCSTGASRTKTCMEGRFTDCSAEYKAKISGWGDDYKNKLCKADGTLKDPELWDPLNYTESDPGGSISIDHYCSPVRMCSPDDNVPMSMIIGSVTKPFAEFQPVLHRYMKKLLKCVQRFLRVLPTCTDDDAKGSILFYVYTMKLYGSSVSLADVSSVSNALPREGVRTTLVSFGNRHFRVFKGDQFVTCGAVGPRVYLLNDYITIMGNYASTVMKQLNITLYSAPGQKLATYTALAGDLPTTFDDGKATAGTGDKGAEVKSGARLTTILHKAAGAAVLMGKRGTRYTMMLVRMSNTMLEESSGLLLVGCLSEIDITSGAPPSACVTACASVPEDYRTACEFDCDVTGDHEFATSASSDVLAGEEEALAEDIAITDDGGGGSGSRMSWSISLTLTTFFFALVNA